MLQSGLLSPSSISTISIGEAVTATSDTFACFSFTLSTVYTVNTIEANKIIPSSLSTVHIVNNIEANKIIPACECSSACSFSSIFYLDMFWHLLLGHMPFHKMKSHTHLKDKLSKK